MSESSDRATALRLRIGREELLVRQRYETASIVNDILIAVWFIVGSVMFFSTDWTRTGTWCFLLGSVELLIRPVIRLSRHVHLGRFHNRYDPHDRGDRHDRGDPHDGRGSSPTGDESTQDF